MMNYENGFEGVESGRWDANEEKMMRPRRPRSRRVAGGGIRRIGVVHREDRWDAAGQGSKRHDRPK